MNNLMILSEVDSEYSHQVECLRFRHKKANDIYKLIVFLTMLALSVSLYSWGLDVWAQHRADQQTEDARKVWNKELADKEAAAQQAQEEEERVKATSLDAEAEAIAKAFYGIRLLIEKYHYTDSDLETYARCIFNRYDAGNGLNSIHTIVSRPDQFTGYDDNSSPYTEQKELALKLLKAWHAETTKPCKLDYQFAELTPDGIFLVTKPDAGPYERRWHA